VNCLFLDALCQKNKAERPPVWLMRQAGRYMASYRKIRAQHSFLEMCKNPELITEVTLLPIRQFGFDAAIVFSDILLIAEAMGFGLAFEDGKGPVLRAPPRFPEDVAQLRGKNIKEELSFVLEGITLLKKELTVPLIGFAGAPFTVACYMIEGEMTGKKNRELKKTKEWMFSAPEKFHQLLEIISDYTVEYLNAQIEHGVEAIQLFDSWAHVLGNRQFEQFSKPYIKRILDRLNKCPRILFAKGASCCYESLAELNLEAISLDWQSSLLDVRKRLSPKICLQGNLDPDILLASRNVVEEEAHALLAKMRHDPAFIFNLGHGILPETPEENVQALVECVKNFS
jgi:uroporphyrinogen decarboxylase